VQQGRRVPAILKILATEDHLRLSTAIRRQPPFYLQMIQGDKAAQILHSKCPERNRKTMMTTIFGATSTTEDVLAGVNLHGKRILVTGVSAGLGVETARSLVAHGAEVVGAARDLVKAEAAAVQVRQAAAAQGGSFELVKLDLADLKSVRACAGALLDAGKVLDVVIANAGVMATPFGHTADGFETQFGTNHLGHFVFVNRIAPLIRTGGRLINLSSSGHRFSNVDLDDPNFGRTPYEPFIAYGRSKTANILFAVAFDRRHRERGVRAAAVHPGGIHTELARHLEPGRLQSMVEEMTAQLAAEGQGPLQFKTIPQGAATSVWAGIVATADEIGGRYCENCHVGRIVPDDVTISPLSEGVRGYALDPDTAQALWKKSEEMAGESF
jgi:NAD(P)-dependent dehydrogenase (short-subunit alcohol dehydrogenase family)